MPLAPCTCDRCGRIYDRPEWYPDLRIIKYTSNVGFFRMFLCPQCQKDLNDFIHNRPISSEGEKK